MKKLLFNLQMFAEGGGDGAGAATGETAGSESSSFEGAKATGKGSALANVVYGLQEEDGSIADHETAEQTAPATKTKTQSFEELIKGEYKDEFNKRTQSIIDKRFKETKSLEEKLQKNTSIMARLAEKYGVDGNDPDAVLKALDSDDSFYEQAALEKGLTVKQYKELKALERENEEFRRAEEEARSRQHSEQIYSQWMEQAEALKAKYGLENFDFRAEVQNPDFSRLLQSGISVEAAYKAIHMDDMIGGAMAKTADVVRQNMANNIASRQSRPTENGVSPKTTHSNFKPDVNSWTKADREEVERRVMRGAIIRL